MKPFQRVLFIIVCVAVPVIILCCWWNPFCRTRCCTLGQSYVQGNSIDTQLERPVEINGVSGLELNFSGAPFTDALTLTSNSAQPVFRMFNSQSDSRPNRNCTPQGYAFRLAGSDLILDRRFLNPQATSIGQQVVQSSFLSFSLPTPIMADRLADMTAEDWAAFKEGRVESGVSLLVRPSPIYNRHAPAVRIERDPGFEDFVELQTDYLQVASPGATDGNVFVIAKDGNCGIGTSNPQHKLDVNGDICASNVTCTSDEKFKKDIHTITDALAKTVQLRGVDYEWQRDEFPTRSFPSGRQIGLVAQEVQQVLPEVVSSDADGSLSMDYSRLTALLIEAIKEQERQIEELRIRVRELGTR